MHVLFFDGQKYATRYKLIWEGRGRLDHPTIHSPKAIRKNYCLLLKFVNKIPPDYNGKLGLEAKEIDWKNDNSTCSQKSGVFMKMDAYRIWLAITWCLSVNLWCALAFCITAIGCYMLRFIELQLITSCTVIISIIYYTTA